MNEVECISIVRLSFMKSALWNDYNVKGGHHENSAMWKECKTKKNTTWKKCNLKEVQCDRVKYVYKKSALSVPTDNGPSNEELLYTVLYTSIWRHYSKRNQQPIILVIIFWNITLFQYRSDSPQEKWNLVTR